MITRTVVPLAVLVLIGCAQPTLNGDDEGDDETEPVADLPHAAVCSGGAQRCFAQVRLDDTGSQVQTFAAPAGYGPADLTTAYRIKTSRGTIGTIAIVDAYNYAAAESDLAKYRSHYGLPACTTANGCFRRVNQNGAASPLPGNAPAGDDWTVEAALDLDMASAACPTCKLILVEANDDVSDGLYIANSGAASLSPTVISNSWGGTEQGNEASYEHYFDHPGIGIFVSSGDTGYDDGGAGPQYPSTSAHVTAVGGTTLTRSTNTRGWADKAWSEGGSSCSGSIAKPSYQTSSACTRRAASDVSAVGDPNTGVAVYNAGSGGWLVVGGTSASSPFIAGVYALYNLGAKTPGWAYANAADFYDVKSGRNGTCSSALCRAGVGWDGPTGVGVPNGNKL